MIAFRCIKCQKAFTVPDGYAGKRAKCKGCGTEITVPTRSDPSMAPAAPTPARPPLRVRRLLSDAELMTKTFAGCEHIRIESTHGDPPELYRIAFKVNGLTRDKKGRPTPLTEHIAEVQLGAEYPRLPPVCKMVTPIFHPNIDESHICIGDHWTAGERLVDLVIRIAEMIGYQAYNIRSPLDGEAAMWADLNAPKLPIDPKPMQPQSTNAVT